MTGCRGQRSLNVVFLTFVLMLGGCSKSAPEGEYRSFTEAQNSQDNPLDAPVDTQPHAPATTTKSTAEGTASTAPTSSAKAKPGSVELTGAEVKQTDKNDKEGVKSEAVKTSDAGSVASEPAGPPSKNAVGDPTALATIRRIPNANVAGAMARKTSTPLSPSENTSAPADTKSDAPRKVQLLVPQKDFRVEGPEDAIRVTYDDIDLLKVLNMEPVTPTATTLMPPWLKSLDGKKIRIRGFMYPAFEQTGLTRFALARDNQICCFGKDPKIYDLFPVKLREGKTTHYIENRPFDVVGVFRIRPYDEDGKLLQLYRIEDAIVIEK